MSVDRAVTDEDFLRAFERRRLPASEWTHRAHLRVAYLYLRRWPFDEALRRMRDGIRAYNAAIGVEDGPDSGYHETLTVVWLSLVAAALRGDDAGQGSRAFCDEHPELCDKRAPLRHYSRRRLLSRQARRAFVAPDLAPLPVSPAPASVG